MFDEDLDDLEDLSPELFNTSDLDWDIRTFRKGKEIHLVCKSPEHINLMRYYLGLRLYIERMELEIGVMAESGEVN
jgi:hypothetical protein